MKKVFYTTLIFLGLLLGQNSLFGQCRAAAGTIQSVISNNFCPGSAVPVTVCGYNPGGITYILMTDAAGNIMSARGPLTTGPDGCALAVFTLPATCGECYNFYSYNFFRTVPATPDDLFPPNVAQIDCTVLCCDLSAPTTYCGVDNEPPSATGLDDVINIECGAEIDYEIDVHALTVIDNCSTPSVSYLRDIRTGTGCPGDALRVERLYALADVCGNGTNFVQTFAYEAPVLKLDCETIGVECFEEIVHSKEQVIDSIGCEVDYYIEYDLVKVTEVGGPFCNLTCYHYAYDVKDACGQQESCTKIYVIINDGPIFQNGPESIDDLMEEDTIVLHCDPYVDEDIEDWLDSKVAMGHCDDDSVNQWNTYDPNGFENGCGAGNTGEQLVTFYAEDQCGRLDTCWGVIVLLDTIPPNQKQIAKDLCISCSDDIETEWNDWLANNGGARAVDYCGAVTWSTDPADPDYFVACSAEEGGIDVTFIASDDCGNTLTSTANFKILNDGPPTVDVEAMNMDVDCTIDYEQAFNDWLANNGGAQASGCGNLTWSYDPPNATLDICNNAGGTMVTFTATDECNQSISTSATFNVSDSGAPTLSATEDLNLDCSVDPMTAIQAWLDDHAGSVATDDCTDVTWTNDYAGLQEDCPGSGTALVTFTATDECSNASTVTATVSVSDMEGPDISAIPEEYTVECGPSSTAEVIAWLEDFGGANISDGCSDVSLVSDAATFSIIPDPDCPGTGTGVVNYTVSDECGNESTGSVTVSVVDTTAPVFGDVPTDKSDDITATDNCGDVNITISDEPIAGAACTCIRTWTATDACGNSASVSGEVSGTDGTNPTIVYDPADLNVACGNDIDPSVVTATDDNPGVMITWTLISDDDECDADGSVVAVYEFTATDACGNSVSETLTFTADSDNEPPVFVSFPNNLTFYCSEGIVWPDPVIEDNCSGVTLTCETWLNDGAVEENCNNGFGYDIFKLWTATDACGNSSQASSLAWAVTDDYVGPKFEFVPEDMEVECGQDLAFGEAICNSQCGNVTLTFEDVTMEGDCANGGEYIRIWTGTDQCGKVSTAQQVITVPADTEAPIFTFVPDNKISECGETIEFGTPACEDNCATINHLNVQYNDAASESGCGLIRTWTVTDLCGNIATASQEITFNDTEAPTFENIVETKSINCGENPVFDFPTISDLCGEVTHNYVDQTLNENCAGQNSLQRTWTATDACGNIGTFSQTIEFIDNDAPIFEAMEEVLYTDCSGNVSFAQANATDQCGGLDNLTFEDSAVQELDCTNCISKTIRTWTAVDVCGNVATMQQELHLMDYEAPVFSNIESFVEIDCGADYEFDVPEATDECGVMNVYFEDEELEGDCSTGKLMTRHWFALDAAGNESSIQQTIKVFDNIAPVIETVLEDKEASCGTEIDFDAIIAADACTEITIKEEVITEQGNCPSAYVLTKVWVVEDACGNQATTSQSISYSDTDAPVFEALAMEKVISCNDAFEFDVPVANDACSTVELSFEDEEMAGTCNGLRSVIRTWTATDACGQAETIVQHLITEDLSIPEFSYLPEDKIIQCGDDVVFENAEGFDACTEVTLTYEDYEENQACEGNSVFIRSWTITDECGNMAFGSQKIVQELDTEAPVLNTVLEDKTISCGVNLEFSEPGFTDNCSTVDLTMVESSESLTCETKHTRTWTAVDACGNETVVAQVITQVDQEAPIFSNAIEDQEMTYEYYKNFVAPQLSATDNCGEVDIQGPIVEESGECQDLIYTHTYTAIDDCGLSTSTSFQVSISDAMPEFNFEEPGVVDCGEELTLALNHLSSTSKTIVWDLVAGADNGWEISTFNANGASIISGTGEAIVSVKSANELGCEVSHSITLTCERSVTSASTIKAVETLAIMPNPVSDRLTLQLESSQSSSFDLSIVDMLGRTLKRQVIDVHNGQNSFEIEVMDLISGAYFINLQNGKEHQAIKFIKQ